MLLGDTSVMSESEPIHTSTRVPPVASPDRTTTAPDAAASRDDAPIAVARIVPAVRD